MVAAIAVAALGRENVLGVSMPGPYSSDGSRSDARQLAENLGIEFVTLPIAEVFNSYRHTLADAFKGRTEDVTEENLQARVRGNFLMALSNKFGSMVLSTGNKSEMGVGYCTLYGDMAGGLAMLSDVPKTMVYALAEWINRERELIPRASIEKAPSAELRPDQTDQDSLPPYDVLDKILKAYIEDVKSPEEIAAQFGFNLELVHSIAGKVDRNEYKRRQAPPGLKITSRAFGLGRPFRLFKSSNRERSFNVLRKVTFYFAVCLAMSQLPAAAQTPSPKEASQTSKAANPTPAKSGTVEGRIEQYLRNLYAWGPAYTVKVGPPKPSPIADLLEVAVTVSMGEQSDTAVVYVSKTGDFLMRGELTDMSIDPFAATRAKLHAGTSPSMGPEDAKITLIEFADFECPSCRQLDLVLRDLLPRHPEVRLVFKNYPLTEIHPWAMTAAIASLCAFHQNPHAFWKMHDAIYDAQEVISPQNVWDKMQDLANQEGLNAETYKSCMINPQTAEEVKSTIAEGHAVAVTATPTTFINGRRAVGPDKSMIEQYIAFVPAHL